jgi:hypothetical protein
MPVFDEMGDFLKTLRVYLLGRGLMSLVVMLSVMGLKAAGAPIAGAALIIAGGAAVVSAGMRIYSEMQYESRMTDLYRDDIAKHLGIAPEQVTRTHLRYAARENEVISQALNRQRRLNIVSFATTALAAAATFSLISFGLAGDVAKFFVDTFGESWGKPLNFISAGIVSGFSSLILHNGLEEAIGYGSGWNKAVAHDLIVAMSRDVKRGKTVTPEQVYAVIVARSEPLQAAIKREFKEPYDHMKEGEQRKVLQRFGVAAEMQQIAEYITRGEISPGRLAYMMQYADPKPRLAVEEQPAPVPTRARTTSFVERMGLAPREEGMSHRERLEQQSSAGIAAAR